MKLENKQKLKDILESELKASSKQTNSLLLF